MGCECAGLVYRAIGADLSTIGEGTFGNNNSLVSITVATGNPTYCSVDNILYSKDMAILFLAGKKSAPPHKKYVSPYGFAVVMQENGKNLKCREKFCRIFVGIKTMY